MTHPFLLALGGPQHGIKELLEISSRMAFDLVACCCQVGEPRDVDLKNGGTAQVCDVVTMVFQCSFMVIHALDGARGYPLDLGNLNITIRHYQPLRTIIHHYSQKYKHYYIYLYSVDGPTIFSPNTWGFLLFSRSRSTLLASRRIG